MYRFLKHTLFYRIYLIIKNIFQRKTIYSLKDRITRAFLITSIITFVLVSFVSYFTIYSILYNKIEKGIDSALDKTVKDMDSAFDNLTSVSEQLSYEGAAARDLSNFLTSESYAEKRRYYDDIDVFLSLIDFTNPNVGLHFYYDRKSLNMLFTNGSLNREFDINNLPQFMQKSEFSFYGPHLSFNSDKNDLVMSVSSPVKIIDGTDYSLYIETDSKTLSKILKRNQLGMDMYYTIVNDKGQVTYSEMPNYFPVKSIYKYNVPNNKMAKKGEYYIFTKKSSLGWMLAAAIKKSVFNIEIKQWILRMAAIGILLMIVGIAIGFVIWRSVYRSIKVFKNEINLMADSNFDSELTYTNITEFDNVLGEFYSMKQKVRQLMFEIKQKEKDRHSLEVDKLLYQINPHFLYNTLNIVQWMAKADGHEDIVKFVSNLVRLLRYNLGKEGSIVTIEREVAALKDYISLQKVRSDYRLEVIFNIDERTLNVPIPRFILQPLVENSIYHGLNGEDGCIWINVLYSRPDTVSVLIKDNGQGMSREMIKGLLEGENTKRGDLGLGIGLNYVNKVLQVHYGYEYKLNIKSQIGVGTIYRFNIPISGEGA
ncbi:MAG: histidine kinase [Clostridiales bacterium]|nr:histidine kinase [Clostridiales bacterium]